MHKATSVLSSHLSAWAAQTLPVVTGEAVPAFGLDRPPDAKSRMADLFFNTDLADRLVPGAEADIPFLRGQVLSSQALRNMLYPEVLRHHTDVQTLTLHFSVSGAFAYRLKTQSPGPETGAGAEVLPELEELDAGFIETSLTGAHILPQACSEFDLTLSLDKRARLYWELEALGDSGVLHDMAISLTAPKDTDGRMVVVMRTFGRTADVLELLATFDRQSQMGAGYHRALRNIFFLVLDTSPEVDAGTYADVAQYAHLNVHVMQGANLGGGGNMSQALWLLDSALAETDVTVDELLLLDDDLEVSLESVRRHWATTLFRTDNTIHTLPVCMKSHPRRVWEDGAFWGRFLDPECSGERRTLAPRLLRHGMRLDDPGYGDKLATLHYPEYCTFIFLGLPYSRFRELGYPAAFFLRGDDIEYCLRHGAEAGRCLSNPNLCAWHEPAHSYGQEYMSIAHGIIINMLYGGGERENFVRFFQDRLKAHAALSDAQGLSLYAHILKDLNDRSLFLEQGFAPNYAQRLATFKAFDADFGFVPKEVLADIQGAAQQRGEAALQAAFLYPNVAQCTEGQVVHVALHNPHTDTYRTYAPQSPEILSANVAALSALARELERFHTEFDALMAHYTARLQATSEAKFWRDELNRYAPPQTLLSGKGSVA